MKNELVLEKKQVYFAIYKKIKCNSNYIYTPTGYDKGVLFNSKYIKYEGLFLTVLNDDTVPVETKVAYNIISEQDLISRFSCNSDLAADEYFKNLNKDLYIQSKDEKTGKYFIINFNNEYLNNYLLNNKKNKPRIIKDMISLYPLIKENVIGQDDAIKRILTILDYNGSILSYRNKNNILLIGPSGSGKTEIFRTIEEITDTVVNIEDMGQYTSAGYKGADIENMLNHLYIKANKDLEKAEHGILVLDEIDKKITSDKSDPSGTRVIDSLLKLIEGTDFDISNQNIINNDSYIFNTSNLTIVLAGAFVDLFKCDRKSVGFNSKLNNSKLAYDDVDIEKLSTYGFPYECLRRINIISLNELSKEDLLEIVTNSKYSVLKEYINYFNLKNVKLNITNEALETVAEEAYNMHIGASGIKAIINNLLSQAMFEVGYNPNTYEELIIDENTIKSIPPYRLVHKKIN